MPLTKRSSRGRCTRLSRLQFHCSQEFFNTIPTISKGTVKIPLMQANFNIDAGLRVVLLRWTKWVFR